MQCSCNSTDGLNHSPAPFTAFFVEKSNPEGGGDGDTNFYPQKKVIINGSAEPHAKAAVKHIRPEYCFQEMLEAVRTKRPCSMESYDLTRARGSTPSAEKGLGLREEARRVRCSLRERQL